MYVRARLIEWSSEALCVHGLPVGKLPPWGDRFSQKMEWLMWPPPLNLMAACTAIMPLTSPVYVCNAAWERGGDEGGMLYIYTQYLCKSYFLSDLERQKPCFHTIAYTHLEKCCDSIKL